MTTEMLSELIGKYSAAITCFCFMGGDAEPFEVERIARWIRESFPTIKTAWYSGKEALPEGFDANVMDFIKLGPFIQELGGLKSPNTNQALYRILPGGVFEKIAFPTSRR